MLKRSNIVAAEEDLQAFYRELDAQSLAALWTQGGGGDPSPRARLCLSCGTGGTCGPRPYGPLSWWVPSRPSVGCSLWQTQGCHFGRLPIP